MIVIKHPNPESGEVLASGITFVDGVAEVESFGDDDIRPILEANGFTFEVRKPTAAEELAEAARVAAEAEEAAKLAAEEAARVEAEKAAAEAAKPTPKAPTK